MRPSSDLKTIDVRASNRKLVDKTKSTKLHKGRANLGIDYEGLEVGGDNLISESPQKNKYMQMAQSIELNKKHGLFNDDINSDR